MKPRKEESADKRGGMPTDALFPFGGNQHLGIESQRPVGGSPVSFAGK